MKVSTRVPLDQLQPPETDVRDVRPEQAVQSIARSMGDPAVGQLQPVLAYPAGYGELDLDTPDDLRQLVRDGHDIILVDGETRRQAAVDELGWHDLWAWIWDEPPENTVVAQLDANTERIDMTEFETVKAVVDHKKETGRTWQEIADDVGFHPSTLSEYANVLESPDWLLDPLRDPDYPLEVGHAKDIRKAVGPDFRQAMIEAGGLDEDEADRKAEQLGRNLVHWTGEYQWSVSELRNGIRRKRQEVLDELEGPSGHREHQRAAEADAATQQAGAPVNTDEEPEACLICGNRATTKIAINVCDQDRGMLTDQQARDEPLMGPAETPEDHPQPTIDSLADALDMDPAEVEARLAEGG